jgi:hypothetical protein
LAYAGDLKSPPEKVVGSSPTLATL